MLSPLIWNLIFDSFLDLFKTGPVRAIGFADDGALVIKGPDPSTLVSIMQEGLEKVQKWSEKQELHLSPSKTVAMIFHRKSSFVEPKKLKLGGVSLEYSSTAKYLAVVALAVVPVVPWHHHFSEYLVQNFLKMALLKRHSLVVLKSLRNHCIVVD